MSQETDSNSKSARKKNDRELSSDKSGDKIVKKQKQSSNDFKVTTKTELDSNQEGLLLYLSSISLLNPVCT